MRQMKRKKEIWFNLGRGGGQMTSKCEERNAPFPQWPFSLPCLCFPALSLLKDVGRGSTNSLWLFVYVQFVRGLASSPPFLKKLIYNSIQVYLPHSLCSTIIQLGPCFSTWFHKVWASVLRIFWVSKTLLHLNGLWWCDRRCRINVMR